MLMDDNYQYLKKLKALFFFRICLCAVSERVIFMLKGN